MANCSSLCHSLKGRAFLNASDFSCEDVKSLLWTAIELKLLHALCVPITQVTNHRVTMLTTRDFYFLPSFHHACDILGVRFTKIKIPDWDTKDNLLDLRKYLERESHLLLTVSRQHTRLSTMYDSPKIPIFNFGSCKCSFVCTLTDFMTYHMHFKRLCGLNLCWFGQVCSLINTYIPFSHKLNMNIRYHCLNQTPAVLKDILKENMVGSQQIRELNPEKDKDYKMDVMMVKGASPNWEQMLKLVPNHSQDMIFLRAFPRTDVSDPAPIEVQEKQKHMERADNLKFVMAAIMLRLIEDYEHETTQPEF